VRAPGQQAGSTGELGLRRPGHRGLGHRGRSALASRQMAGSAVVGVPEMSGETETDTVERRGAAEAEWERAPPGPGSGQSLD
jgi:hypothetical protein